MRKFFQGIFQSKFWKIVSAPFRFLWRVITWPVRAYIRARDFMRSEPVSHSYGEIFSSLANDATYRAEMIENIEHFRKHLLRSLLWLALGVALTAVFTQRISQLLIVPLNQYGELEAVTLTAIEVSESLGVFMRIALLSGIILAFPVIAFEFWLFAAPGLHAAEKRRSLLGIPFAFLLFVGGVVFSYYKLIPAALIAKRFINDYMGYATQWRPDSYFSFTTGLLFWMGVGFEFPILIWILTAVGVVKPDMLKKQWRLAILIIAVLSAAITPTVDPFTMGLVMGPLIVLYFISIGLSYLAVPKQADKPEASPSDQEPFREEAR